MSKIKSILLSSLPALIAGGVAGSLFWKKLYGSRYRTYRDRADKFDRFQRLMTKWCSLRQIDRNVSEFFSDRGIRSIAIYGMMTLGKCLERDLYGSEIDIKYAIDRNADNTYSDIIIHKPGEPLSYVDAVVVTDINAFDNVKKELSELNIGKAISLEEVINETYKHYFAR